MATATSPAKIIAEASRTLAQKLEKLEESVATHSEIHEPDYVALTEAIQEFCAACEAFESTGVDADAKAAAKSDVQQLVGHYIDRSWFMIRARDKPRGYPGDYELLEALYENRARSSGLGLYLDTRFLRDPLARAVRSRMDQLTDFLHAELTRQQKPTAILNVGAGPCRELRSLAGLLKSCPVHITCMDSDPDALTWASAQLRLAGISPSKLRWVCGNALEMPQAGGLSSTGFDIIYSVGLIDYLRDRAVVDLLSHWSKLLNAGGIIYITVKDCTRYSKTAYDWLLDWRFKQRNEDQALGLARAAGFSESAVSITRDATGVILNLTLKLDRVP